MGRSSIYPVIIHIAACGMRHGVGEVFTVSFNANGGVPEPEKQKVQRGGLLVEPEEMAKDGHDFGSWYKDEECTVPWDFERDVVDGDITLYAKWEPSETKARSGSSGGGGSIGGGVVGGAPAPQGITISVTSPVGVLSPIATSTTFTVQVSGFTNDQDADNVGLQITGITGITFSGHDATGVASGGTKSFSVTVTYSTITESFSNPSQTITITGLTNPPTGYAAYSGGNKITTVNIFDGQASYAGSGYDRRIPVSDGNIGAFNIYANTTDGLAKHYKLVEDVTLTVTPGASNWTAIGTYTDRFTGSFDGQNHTIRNLTINEPSFYQGMFGYIYGVNCVLKNIGLHANNITGSYYVGGIVGYNLLGTVENCVALSPVITRTSGSDTTFGRVAGDNVGSFGATGNHARSGMSLPSGISATSDLGGIHGG